jgi:hypothetical protein
LTRKTTLVLLAIVEETDDAPSRPHLPAAKRVVDTTGVTTSETIRPLAKVVPLRVVRKAVGA